MLVQQSHFHGSDQDRISAFIFDLDGVITETQDFHARAWERMFNAFLRQRRDSSHSRSEKLHDFNTPDDYKKFLDGLPRDEGVRSFLSSRHIDLSQDEVEDLGQKKNAYYMEFLDSEGPRVITDTVSFIQKLKEAHIPMGVVSSSRNCPRILKMTGLDHYFDTVITPLNAEKKGLKGKPMPDYFIEASHCLHQGPEKCVVVEDSLSGIEAGKRGGFKKVIGLDHTGNQKTLTALKDKGADEAVSSLWEIEEVKDILTLPNALQNFQELFSQQKSHDYFLFLDYDGTLSPIVNVPNKAEPLEGIPQLLNSLKDHYKICIITGRDTEVIKQKLDIKDIFYAACHGFEITGPQNYQYQLDEAKESFPDFNDAQNLFSEKFGDIEGFFLERKKFGLAFHYRMVKSGREVSRIIREVEEYCRAHPKLKTHPGEKVLEMIPNLDWDKGKAVLKLYEVLNLNHRDLPPLYIGDGLTDEDAFREMVDWGIAILASVEQRATLARFHLSGPIEVKEFLRKLLNEKKKAV